MWASLWNIYDGNAEDDGHPAAHVPRSSPSKSRPAGVNGRVNHAGRAAAVAPSASGNYRGGSNRDLSLQTSLHSTSSNSSGSRRLVVSNATPKADGNTAILRGVIVGEEQCGKTSLIRRLRGEDPFGSHDGNRTKGRTSDRRASRNLMALIPWKIPEQSPVQHQKHPTDTDADDDLVQLYVSEGRSFCHTNKDKSFQKQWLSVLQSSRGKLECDFVVWMIDPRMDDVLQFLQEGLNILFPITQQNEKDDDNKSSSESAKNIKQPLVKHLCILLNFRDLNPTEQKNGSKEESLFDQIQTIVNDVLGQYLQQNEGNAAGTTPTPTILVYESSMKNCYGLQNLHSFIILPYLSHKERELKRRAENARKQHLQWKQGLLEAKAVGYADFVQQQVGKEKQSTPKPKPSIERQKLEEEKERLQRQLKQQNELLQQTKAQKPESADKRRSAPTGKQQRESETKANSLAESSTGKLTKEGSNNQVPSDETDGKDSAQRKLFTKSHQPQPAEKTLPPAKITEHTNLESFFSDDEDDEQTGNNVNSVDNASSDSSSDSDDDDSDDGDFYIDVSGTRCAHVNASKHTKKRSARQSASRQKKVPQTKRAPEPEVGDDDERVKSDSETTLTGEQKEKSDPAKNSNRAARPVEQSSTTEEKVDVNSSPISPEPEGQQSSLDANDTGGSAEPEPISETEAIDSSNIQAESDDNADASTSGNPTNIQKVIDRHEVEPEMPIEEQDLSSVSDEEAPEAVTNTNDEEQESPAISDTEVSDHKSMPVPVDSTCEQASLNGEEKHEGKEVEKIDIEDDQQSATEGEAKVSNSTEEGGEGASDCEDVNEKKKTDPNGSMQQQPSIVMDSDEESVTQAKKDNHSTVNDESDEELVHNTPIAASREPRECPTKPSAQKPSASTPQVSSAALAAIEAARKEAVEQMMAQTQSSNSPSTPKKEKKSKKKKEEKKRKKKSKRGLKD